MSLRKAMPVEVYPLGVFAGAVVAFATYRLYKLFNHEEVMLTKKSQEKFAWKGLNEDNSVASEGQPELSVPSSKGKQNE